MKMIKCMHAIILSGMIVSCIAFAEEEFYLVKAGTYVVGSPSTEDWREKDEEERKVNVEAFYIGITEVTQKEYERVTKENPSSFKGANNPVENITLLDAVQYCNARSRMEGLTVAYKISGDEIAWNKNANGYRLPTEVEWEIACRAGTRTPFNLEKSIGADDANFYGHYPYQIEQNYFTQEKLSTKPGKYRGRTMPVKSFKPNKWGLCEMHGNVSEWTFDFYNGSDYLRVVKCGGWNDFAKHMRSAYRSAIPEDEAFFARGFRVVKNAR